jgi:CRISPR-associated protein Cas1
VTTLYITEQHAILRKTSDRVIVEKDGKVLAEVPCLKLESVLLFGNVQVTTQALAELLEHGIELALLSLSGKLRGQLTPPKAKNVVLRMRQYEASQSDDYRLGIAREFVRAKIENSLSVVRRFRANHPASLDERAEEAIERALAQVDRTGSLPSLLGVEGSAAAAYFPLLASMVPEDLRPTGRDRRPPPDPFNALLSFGYVLAGNEIQALLDAMGFDPYVGFLHEIDYGRPSLALDLLEEFRPAFVDRLSVALLNRQILRRTDFTDDPARGVFLRRESLGAYFRAYEEELRQPLAVGGRQVSLREAFREQAQRLARALRGEEDYRGFRLPC